MYIRCKRTNQTVFLYVNAGDKVEQVKKNLSAIIKHPAENIRLLSHPDYKTLDDDKTLSDCKVENEHIVYWVQKKDGKNYS